MLRKSIVLALAGMAGAAHAAEDSGVFAGAGIGQVNVSDSFEGFSFDANDTAFRLFGGYKINPNFAVELAYIDAGNPTDNIDGVDVSVNATAFQASLIGSIPLNSHLSGFARAGILFWDATTEATDGVDFISDDDSGNDFAWGLGASAALNEKAKLELAFEGADIGGTDYRLISLSFSWLFR